MKIQMTLNDLKGFSYHVATYEKGAVIEQLREDDAMFRPGFYFCIDQKTGVALAMFSVSRLNVTPKNMFSQGVFGFCATVRNAYSYNSKPRKRLNAHNKFDIYHVSMKDAKYLTTQVHKHGSLFSSFAKTPTGDYNNMYEISQFIKSNFGFKFQ